MERGEYLLKKFGSFRQYQKIYQPVLEAALSLDLTLNLHKLKTTPSTTMAHLAHYYILMEKGHQMAENFVIALFEAYFHDGKDIGRINILDEIATKIGLNADEIKQFFIPSNLEPEEHMGVLLQEAGKKIYGDYRYVHSHASSNGTPINGVPFYIFNQLYSIGGAQTERTLLPILDLASQSAHQHHATP